MALECCSSADGWVPRSVPVRADSGVRSSVAPRVQESTPALPARDMRAGCAAVRAWAMRCTPVG
jgi:hypothetical protein